MRRFINLTIAAAVLAGPLSLFAVAEASALESRQIKTDNRPVTIVCPGGLRHKCRMVKV